MAVMLPHLDMLTTAEVQDEIRRANIAGSRKPWRDEWREYGLRNKRAREHYDKNKQTIDRRYGAVVSEGSTA